MNENEKMRTRLEEIRDTVRIINAEELEDFILSVLMGYIRDHATLKKKFYEVAENESVPESGKTEDVESFQSLFQLEKDRRRQTKPPGILTIKMPEEMLHEVKFHTDRRNEKRRECAASVCNDLILFLQRAGRIVIKNVEIDLEKRLVIYRAVSRTFRSARGLPWSLIWRAAKKDASRMREPLGEMEIETLRLNKKTIDEVQNEVDRMNGPWKKKLGESIFHTRDGLFYIEPKPVKKQTHRH